MEPIVLIIDKLWNDEFIPVPDFEIRRCELFGANLDVRLMDRKKKELIDRFIIPPGRFGEAVKSGFKRDIFEAMKWNPSQEYELLMFKASDFRVKRMQKA